MFQGIHRAAATLGFMAFLVVLLPPTKSQAVSATPDNTWPIVDDVVYAIALDPNDQAAYLTGQFLNIGFAGKGGVINATNGTPLGPYPAANDTIYAVISDGDTGWFIGGNFTAIGSTSRVRLAHILYDGSVDPNWNPGADGIVYSLTLAPDGHSLYAGGDFYVIGGRSQKWVAEIDTESGSPTYGLAKAWQPTVDSTVRAVAVDDENVYIGGDFNTVSGWTQTRLAAISRTTAVRASDYNLHASATVRSLKVDNGKIYVGGDFTSMGPYTYGAPLFKTNGLADFGKTPFINGNVFAAVSDGNGGWYIGGDFTWINNVARSRLAHMLSDGTVDPNWNPSANGTVRKLILSGSTLYVGGAFTQIGTNRAWRQYIGAIDATSGSALPWNPSANATVYAMALGSGVIYLGGDFTQFRGTTNRQYAAAIDLTTGLATAFAPNPNNVPRSIVTDGTTVFFGGFFTSFAGSTRNHLAAVNVSDHTLKAWDPNVDGNVYTVALDGTTLYVGGMFNTINGATTRRSIAAVDTTTGIATAWDPAANQWSEVFTIIVDGSTVYAGGSFTNMGGQTRSRLAAISATTGAATSWNPNANGVVYTIAINDTMVYAGGSFNAVGWTATRYLASITHIGDIDLTWSAAVNPNTTVYALRPSGSTLYAGGDFTTIGGQSRTRLAALDMTTGLASAWNPSTSDRVHSIDVSGSNVYVTGWFGTVNGSSWGYVIALDATTGTRSSNWLGQTNGVGYGIAVSNDRIYVGGSFTRCSVSRARLAKITSTGAIDQNWNPGINANGRTLYLTGDTLYVGGEFTTVGGQNRNRLAAINRTDGSLLAWDPNANGNVYAIQINGDSVFVGGAFTQFAGTTTRYRLAEISASTGLATVWTPDPNDDVYSLLIDNGYLYVGGPFTIISGNTRKSAAAFDVSTKALQTWNPTANDGARIFAIESANGLIHLGGSFTTLGGQSRTYLAAVTPAGVAYALQDWNPAPNGWVRSLKAVGNTLYVGGDFTVIGASAYLRNYLAAVDLTTAEASTWIPGLSTCGNSIQTIQRTPRHLYVGGCYSGSAVDSRYHIARYPAPTISFQSAASSLGESSGLSNIRIVLSDAQPVDTDVDVRTVAGTATADADYISFTTTITIPDGNTTYDLPIESLGDSAVEGSENFTVELTGVTMPAGYDVTVGSIASHTVNITDDDTSSVPLTQTGGMTLVQEGGATDSYSVVLTSRPSADVTITVSPTAEITVSPLSLTFTTANWNVAQNVTVTAVDDATIEGVHPATITHTASSADLNYHETPMGNISVTIADNDSANYDVVITPSGGNTVVTEGGASDTYAIALSSAPAANVVLSFTPSAEIGIVPASLTFTAGNWNTPQQLTVSAIDDAIVEGQHSGSIAVGVTSADGHYNGIAVDSLPVVVLDNDSINYAVLITPDADTTVVKEGGVTGSYEVTLTSAPAADVDITISTNADYTVSPTTLTFTVGNWSTPQQVTVTAENDSLQEEWEAHTITHSISSIDPNYTLAPVTLAIVVIDNDSPGITVAETGGTTAVTEGSGSDTYTVVLNTRPTANVVIDLSAPAGIVRAPAQLTFTNANWDTPQTITVTAVDDADVNGTRAARITHSASSGDGNYHLRSIPDLVATITDNDTAPSGGGTPTCDPISANAGTDRTIRGGATATLDGSASQGTSLRYFWTVTSGAGSLANETTVTPTFTASTGTHTITLYVVDTCSNAASDAVSLTFIAEEQTRGEVLETPLVQVQSGVPVYRSQVTTSGQTRNALSMGSSQLLLPTGLERYTIAITSDRRLVLGMPEARAGAGVALVSARSIDHLSSTIDLTPIVSGELASTELIAMNVSGINVGESIAASDMNGDGIDEIVVSSTRQGLNAIEVFASDLSSRGSLISSNSTEIGTIVSQPILSNTTSDILFGPLNSGMNAGLTRVTSVTTSSAITIVSGSSATSGAQTLDALASRITLGTGGEYQSATTADFNHDGIRDVAMADTQGNVLLFFGPYTEGEERTREQADVVIQGGSAEDGFGRMIAAGDVTGDGIADLVVGAPEYGADDTGAVYVVYGQATWEASVDVLTSSSVQVISGPTAQDAIGSDLLLSDEDSDGILEIYTIKGLDDVYKIALVSTNATNSGDEGDTGTSDGTTESDAFKGGGATCSLCTEGASSLSTYFLIISILIFLFSTRAQLHRSRSCDPQLQASSSRHRRINV